MGGSRGHHAKLNKPDREKQIQCNFTHSGLFGKSKQVTTTKRPMETKNKLMISRVQRGVGVCVGIGEKSKGNIVNSSVTICTMTNGC